MTRTTYDRISFSVPEGWIDNSVITLLGPVPPPRMIFGRLQPQAERPNLVIKKAWVSNDPLDLDDFAKQQEEMMANMAEDIRVVERGSISLEHEGKKIPVITREYCFSAPPHLIRQIHFYFQVDSDFFIVCGTGLQDENFPNLRTQFIEIINDFRFS